MKLPELREALAVRLRTVPALPNQQKAQVEARLKSMITPPTLMVAYPQTVDYHHQSMYGSRWEMVVFGIGAAGAYDESAQHQIDAWLANEGEFSVALALEADPSLGGISEDVTVIESTGYQVYQVDQSVYLGTEWRVEILG